MLEFTLAPDGAVASVEPVGDRAGDEIEFAETLQSWRAAPPGPECAGPYPYVSAFLFPREGLSTTR